MSYLELAKQAEARLRAAREIQPEHERNEVTKEGTPPARLTAACPFLSMPLPEQGVATSGDHSLSSLSRPYAHPWPDALPGLGPRTIVPFDCCIDCVHWTWVRYGPAALCLAHANARARGAAGSRRGDPGALA